MLPTDCLLKNNGKGNVPVAILRNKTNVTVVSNANHVKEDEIQALLKELNDQYQLTTNEVYIKTRTCLSKVLTKNCTTFLVKDACKC